MVPVLLSTPPELGELFRREIFLKLVFRNDALYTDCTEFLSLGTLKKVAYGAVHLDAHLLMTFFMGVYYSRYPVNKIYLNVDPQLDTIMKWSEDIFYITDGWVLLAHARHSVPPSWLSSLESIRLVAADISVEQTLCAAPET
ncbi:MAG: hypothetical protein [Pedras lispivirus]